MSTKRGKYSKEEITSIENMYSNGESVENIAETLNRSAKSVFNTILKHGFKQGKRTIVEATPVEAKSKKVFAKPNQWSDDGVLALADRDIDAKIIRRPVERTRKNNTNRKIMATCRHCDEKKMAEASMVMDGEFSCKTCLMELSSR